MLWHKWSRQPRILSLRLILCTRARAHTQSALPTPQLSGPGTSKIPQSLRGPNMETEAQPGEELAQALGKLLRPNSRTSAKSLYKW